MSEATILVTLDEVTKYGRLCKLWGMVAVDPDDEWSVDFMEWVTGTRDDRRKWEDERLELAVAASRLVEALNADAS